MRNKKIIDEKTVKDVAKLSRLKLGDKEVALHIKQLGDILNYIEKLNEINTSKTPPTSHPLEALKNVFRKDIVRQSLPQEKALQNAPEEKNNFYSDQPNYRKVTFYKIQHNKLMFKSQKSKGVSFGFNEGKVYFFRQFQNNINRCVDLFNKKINV